MPSLDFFGGKVKININARSRGSFLRAVKPRCVHTFHSNTHQTRSHLETHKDHTDFFLCFLVGFTCWLWLRPCWARKRRRFRRTKPERFCTAYRRASIPVGCIWTLLAACWTRRKGYPKMINLILEIFSTVRQSVTKLLQRIKYLLHYAQRRIEVR